jgi:uncharacterized protein (DUF952 family)
VEIDTDGVGAELRIEDTYGSGTEFPHVYGPIPTTVAVAVHPIDRTTEGAWTFSPDGGASGPA